MTHPDRSLGRWRLDRRAFLATGVTLAITAPIAWGCAGGTREPDASGSEYEAWRVDDGNADVPPLAGAVTRVLVVGAGVARLAAANALATAGIDTMFAGEATSPDKPGTAEGAFQTGIREAKRLLQEPRVTLGLPR